MEKFLEPKNREKFVGWILKESIKNKWVLVFEYNGDEGYKFLKENAIVIDLPISVVHNCDDDCKLTAVINPIVTSKLISELIKGFNVLSVYDESQMIFLIADDFHPDCFSCSPNFYDNYYTILSQQNLIKNA